MVVLNYSAVSQGFQIVIFTQEEMASSVSVPPISSDKKALITPGWLDPTCCYIVINPYNTEWPKGTSHISVIAVLPFSWVLTLTPHRESCREQDPSSSTLPSCAQKALITHASVQIWKQSSHASHWSCTFRFPQNDLPPVSVLHITM